MAVRLGDLLVERGLLTESQRAEIVRRQKRDPRPFGAIAERLYGVRPEAVEQAWADQFARITATVDPRDERVDSDALGSIERRQAWQFRVLPLRYEGGDLVICTTREHLVRALKFTGWRLTRPCHFVLADPLALGEALMRYYRLEGMNPAMVMGRGPAVP